MPATLTVADLNRRCAQLGLDPATTILLIERDIPTPVTVADQSVTIAAANDPHRFEPGHTPAVVVADTGGRPLTWRHS